MSVQEIVTRAREQAQREHGQRLMTYGQMVYLLENLPQVMAHERAVRGLTASAAASQAGIRHQTWSELERGRSHGHIFTAVRILRWLEGNPCAPAQ